MYGLEENTTTKLIEVVGPLYFTKLKQKTHINLLYLEEGLKSHFVLIKNLSKLVASQISAHGHQIYLCDGCLIKFPSQQALDRHLTEDCNKVRTILPSTELKKIKLVI